MTGFAGFLDALDEASARAALHACCGSRRFVDSVLARRPFVGDDALLVAVATAEDDLDDDDWREAFAAHPRIGARAVESTWSRQEQSGMVRADASTRHQLARANERYESRFGHVFLICATGLDADTMLAALQRRLGHDADTELREAAREQRKITRLRLAKLVAGEGASS